MRRVHAFEFNDMPACPPFIRDAIVEVLGDGLRRNGFYDEVAGEFLAFCEKAGVSKLLDLCSGSGQPAAALVDACLRRPAPVPAITLTDLFPNQEAMAAACEQYPNMIEAMTSPVDATQLPAELDHDACSIICAFHHFTPEQAEAIVCEQVRNRRGLFILEPMPREPWRAGPMLAGLASSYMALPWRTRSDRLRKGLSLYPIPLVALAGAWDATISALRSYTEADFRQMADKAGGDYEWTYREIPFSPAGRAIVFHGVPKEGGC